VNRFHKESFLASGIQIKIMGKTLLRWGNCLAGNAPYVGKESIESISNLISMRYDHIVGDEFSRHWGYLRTIGDKMLQN